MANPLRSSKAADLLTLATLALRQVMSGQHTLACADERRSTLQQLAVTVQAGAKLAELAHKDVVREVKQTERIKEETGKPVAETARLQAEAETIARETLRPKPEEERAVHETERLKAHAMVVRSEKMRIDAETERVKAETERRRFEAETANKEAARAVAESALKNVEAETVGKGVESSAQVHNAGGAKSSRRVLTLEQQIQWRRVLLSSEGVLIRSLRGLFRQVAPLSSGMMDGATLWPNGRLDKFMLE